jgi:alcohol dehydrogenase YqhD (iron-dependent ADH family)
MQDFVWYNPTKLILGRGVISQIGEELHRDGRKKVLVIGGAGSIKKNGVYAAVADSLQKAGIDWNELWDVKPNPVLSKVLEGIDIAKSLKVDAVVGIGGGSVIDTAKAIAAGVFETDVWDIFNSKLARTVVHALPIYTVVTISASGSEMSPFAVITNENKKQKYDIMGSALFPRVSIVDPAVQRNLPWNQTFNGAFDAMSHIMEYYFAAQLSSEITLSLSESMLLSIIKIVDRLLIDPTEYESRANLAWAATLALNGTSAAGLGNGDWASHRIAMGLSAIYPSIAHGAWLAAIFPAWITYCSDAGGDIFKRWAKMVWGSENIGDAVNAMKSKIHDWHGPTSLAELGVKRSQVEMIAKTIADFGVIGSVKKLNEQDIKKIIELAF